MAASVEVRVPFVDPVVAEAAFSIDGHDKIRRGKSKIALKQAAANWLLEAEDRAPAEGILQRSAARLGPARPARDDPGRAGGR